MDESGKSLLRMGVSFSQSSWEQVDQLARLRAVSGRDGLEVIPLGGADAFLKASCDFILSLDVDQPKTSAIPTYVLLNQPATALAGTPARLRNILTYDGFLSLDPGLRQWIASLALAMGKPDAPTAAFDVTAGRDDFAPTLGDRHLAYCRQDPADPKHADFLGLLADLPTARFFRPAPAAGSDPSPGAGDGAARDGVAPDGVAPDGKTARSIYRESGIALCLTDPDHADTDLAPRALYDILSAGALGITIGTRFLRQAFGSLTQGADTVLFLNEWSSTLSLMSQVRQHLAWISNYPEEALARARKAKEIFDRQFSIEALLPNLVAMHRQVARQLALPPVPASFAPEVTVLVCCPPGMPPAVLRRMFQMLAAQTYRRLRVVAVAFGDTKPVASALEAFPELNVTVLQQPEAAPDTTLHAAGADLGNELFMLLNETNEWFPRHVESLVAAFARSEQANSGAAVAHSGVVAAAKGEPAKLVHFEPRLTPLQGAPLGSWLARSYLVDSEILNNPDLAATDDASVARMIFAKARSVFTGEVTCGALPEGSPVSEHVMAQLDLVGGTTLGENLVPGAQTAYGASLPTAESLLAARAAPSGGERTDGETTDEVPPRAPARSPIEAAVDWLKGNFMGDNLIAKADLKDFANWWIKDILVRPPPSAPDLAPPGHYRVVVVQFPTVWVPAGVYCLFIKLLARKEQRQGGLLFGCDIVSADGQLIQPAIDFARDAGYPVDADDRGFSIYRLLFSVAGPVNGIRIKLWNFDNAELLVRSVRVMPWPAAPRRLLDRELRSFAVSDESCILVPGAIAIRNRGGERPAVRIPIRSATGVLAPGHYDLRLKVEARGEIDPGRPFFAIDVCASNGEFLMYRNNVMLSEAVEDASGGLDFTVGVEIESIWGRYGEVSVRLLAGGNGEFKVRSAVLSLRQR